MKLKMDRDLRTVLTVAAVFLALAALFRSVPAATAALALALSALLSPRFAAAAAAAWLRFGEALGSFNTRLILGLIYFLVLTPVAFISRFFRPSPLRLKREPGTRSYFRECRHSYGPADLEKPW